MHCIHRFIHNLPLLSHYIKNIPHFMGLNNISIKKEKAEKQ